MPFRFNHLAASLALAGLANFAHGAGFALIEQNASGLGNAYAGQAAAATDASTIFFNPAGMTYLPDRQVVMAGHLILPQARFSGSSNIGGGNGGDAGGLAFVPNAYFAFRLTPDVHLGVGMNAPFGLATEYDPTWAGRTQAIKSEVKTINLNPSIAWKASEALSLGAGLSLQYAEATLSNATGAGAGAPVGVVKGEDYGWGFNLGVLWQPNAATRVGLAYRSEVDYVLEGDLKVNGVVTQNPVFANATMPDSAALSVFHRLNERWDILADVTWTGWSDFYELRIYNGGNVTVVPPTLHNWRDTWRYSVGANYRHNDRLMLRGGLAFDQRAASDAYRTARIPDEDRTWLAFGAQYRLTPRMVMDVGYAHLFVSDARINKAESGVTLDGTYDASVDILSAQLTLNF